MDGAKAIVLDNRCRPCPPNTVGEIYLRTPYRTLGYYQNPELTNQVFLPNPFNSDPNDTVYRTGDFGRVLPDGNFEFVGRRDGQVKVRGVRVELAEIENAFRLHPGVNDVVVAPYEDGTNGVSLCAYIVGNEKTNSSELREHASNYLPDYMLPSAVAMLDSLPRTSTGKVDRKALPPPMAALSSQAGKYVPPQTGIEEILCDIWKQLLLVPAVSRHDNFFEMGGHSLMAVQLASRIQNIFGVEIALRRIMDNATIVSLADVVQQAISDGNAPPVAPLSHYPGNGAPLSFAQERLWFLDQLMPGNAAYNMSWALLGKGALSMAGVRRSFGWLVERHEVLRTRIVMQGGQPRQQIDQGRLELPVVDLAGMSGAEALREARRWAEREALRGFDLSAGPLLRAIVLRLSADEHVLLVTLHHIVGDAWSLSVLVRELTGAYQAFARGAAPQEPPLAWQYADYAHWQRQHLAGERLAQLLDYWRQQVQGVAALELPSDHPRPARLSYRGAYAELRCEGEFTAQLERFARERGATLFMLLLAGFQLLLSRYSRQPQVLAGTPVAGRNRLEWEHLIGFFVNTLLLRGDTSGDPTVEAWLQRARQTCLHAYAHQDLPLEKLVEDCQPERDLSRHPLFQVMFVLQNTPAASLPPAAGLSWEPLPGLEAPPTAKFDLSLIAQPEGQQLRLLLEYSTDLYEASTAARLLRHYRHLLSQMLAYPDRPLSALSLLDPAEQRELQLLAEGVRAQVPAGTVVDWIEHQAQNTPSAIAIFDGNAEISYAELDRRANAIASALRARQAREESLVGISLPRSAEMIVALLGTLKAGAAYIPLDPQLPEERLIYLLENAGLSLLICDSSVPARVTVPVVTMEMLAAEAPAVGHPPERLVTGGNLAYVIYTSGSTGHPKGVMISHEGLAISSYARRLYYADRVHAYLHLSPFWFDSAVAGIFWTLCDGGTLLIPSEREQRDIGKLLRLIQNRAASHLLCLPSFYEILLSQAASERMNSLRCAIVAGEACTEQVFVRHKERVPQARLINEYGPTEGTVWATAYEFSGTEAANIPIGRPIPNLTVWVLDSSLQPAPIGIPGEIYLAGRSLARGYIGQPALTAERFIPGIWGCEMGGRLYRTGDIGKYLPDGNIQFLGRMDEQVKINGFRVELAEVEQAIRGISSVKDAICIVQREDTGRATRLLAFVLRSSSALKSSNPEMLSTNGAPAADDDWSAALRTELRKRLPEYMVPSVVLALDRFPVTSTGKVDKLALVRIPLPSRVNSQGVLPANEAERMIAKVWESVLGVDKIRRADNFFDLGGHSLTAIHVVSEIQAALHVPVTVMDLFEFPTIQLLAARVASTPAPALGTTVQNRVELRRALRRKGNAAMRQNA
jgi:amino acid adenylation domain-containing protein